MDLENFHIVLEGISSGVGYAQAQAEFENLLQSNPVLLLQLFVSSIQTFTDKTLKAAIVLFGRTATLIEPNFINLGDENFHVSFQNSLLSLIQSQITDYTLIPSLSNTISTFARIYQQQRWSNLFLSLLQFIFNPQQGLIPPPANSPLSSYIATDIIWQCINNESILLNPETDTLQCIISLVQAVLQNPSAINGHQLISTIKLAYYTFSKVPIEQIAAFSIPIVKIITQLPPELLDEYASTLSLFSDDNVLFFKPAILDFLNILLPLATNFESVSVRTRNSSINILTHIISNPQYYEYILPRIFDFYEIFLAILSNSPIDLDPELGLQKSSTTMITEDAIFSLSEQFADTFFNNSADNNILYVNIQELFIECIGKNDLNYIVANLIGFANAVDGNATIYMLSDPTDYINVYRPTLLAEDPKIRCIAVESLNDVMNGLGEFIDDFGANQLIPIIADAIAKETMPIILTLLLKSLKIYFTHFEDYKSFCGPIIELLGSRFQQMNETQQIYVLKCYYQISSLLNQDFIQFMPPIYEFMQSILSNYRSDDPQFPLNLFFTCMELAPKFKCIPPPEFLSLSQSILTFIASITDISPFSSKQMDSINGAICAILDRNPRQFLPYAAKIVDLIFQVALRDVDIERIPAVSAIDLNEMHYDDIIYNINKKTNTIDIYSNSSINMLYEALNTLNDLLKNVDEIIKLNGFANNLINTIQKTFDQASVSKKIMDKLFQLINNFFIAARKNGLLPLLFSNQVAEGTNEVLSKPIAVIFYLRHMEVTTNIINSIIDINGFFNIDLILMNLMKAFLFFCKAFQKFQNTENQDQGQTQLFFEVLSSTIAFVIIVYQKLVFIRVNTNRFADDFSDGTDILIAERYLGLYFGCIFSLMSNLIPAEMIQVLCNTFALQPQKTSNNQLFISSVAFDFWRYYVLLYPGCSHEQGIQIVNLLRELIISNNFESEVIQYSLSTMVEIIVGLGKDINRNPNNLGFPELFEPTILFLTEFFNTKNTVLYAHCVNKELVIMAQKMIENQVDPTPCLQILIKLMPIISVTSDSLYLDRNDGDEIVIDDLLSTSVLRCSDCLLKLSQNNQIQVLQSLEGVDTLVVMATLLRKKVDRSEMKDALLSFIASVVNNPQTGPQVMQSLSEIYQRDSMSNVLKLIQSMILSIQPAGNGPAQ